MAVTLQAGAAVSLDGVAAASVAYNLLATANLLVAAFSSDVNESPSVFWNGVPMSLATSQLGTSEMSLYTLSYPNLGNYNIYVTGTSAMDGVLACWGLTGADTVNPVSATAGNSANGSISTALAITATVGQFLIDGYSINGVQGGSFGAGQVSLGAPIAYVVSPNHQLFASYKIATVTSETMQASWTYPYNYSHSIIAINAEVAPYRMRHWRRQRDMYGSVSEQI